MGIEVNSMGECKLSGIVAMVCLSSCAWWDVGEEGVLCWGRWVRVWCVVGRDGDGWIMRPRRGARCRAEGCSMFVFD